MIGRATVLKAFAALAAIGFLLRIFYAGHLYQDDGLWFTAAEELLRGKALYREIYFDKPPATALLYALLFKVFGAHIITIRLFTILYSIAVSAVLYLFGSRLYGRRAGLVAAAMCTLFSTTYTTGHMQGLNTDFLMTLPYTAGAYLFVRSIENISQSIRALSSRGWMAMAGGALAGLAFQVNPKAVFNLVFFAAILILTSKIRRGAEEQRRWGAGEQRGRGAEELGSRGDIDAVKPEPEHPCTRNRSRRPGTAVGVPTPLHPCTKSTPAPLHIRHLFTSFLLAVAGFIAGAVPFLIYIAATRSLSAYWLDVWDWGHRYAAYYPVWKGALSALFQSANYFALNNTLLIALAFVAVMTIRRAKQRRARQSNSQPDSETATRNEILFQADVMLLVWFAASYAGLAVGGRFFGHYFFQILPALCLIGARGLTGIASALERYKVDGRSLFKRRAVVALIVTGFVFTMVRFHGRTAMLAVDWARGTKSEITAGWFHDRLNHEERMAAAVVTRHKDFFLISGGARAAESVALEAIRDEGLRLRASGGPQGYLFVWGYRPEIYYWSGLLPASRYLSSQPLTGVPADVHYFGDRYVSLLNETETAHARAEFLEELKQTQPAFIIDELGFFNANLSINSYPELREFMKAYKNTGATGRFIIYRKKDPSKKGGGGQQKR